MINLGNKIERTHKKNLTKKSKKKHRKKKEIFLRKKD